MHDKPWQPLYIHSTLSSRLIQTYKWEKHTSLRLISWRHLVFGSTHAVYVFMYIMMSIWYCATIQVVGVYWIFWTEIIIDSCGFFNVDCNEPKEYVINHTMPALSRLKRHPHSRLEKGTVVPELPVYIRYTYKKRILSCRCPKTNFYASKKKINTNQPTTTTRRSEHSLRKW